MKEKLFFYYTSDLHSHFENWPQIVGYFNDQKIKHDKKGEEFWLFDNGDHVDRFHPIAEGLKGKGNVELLNEAGYDIATLGNNEGITLSNEDLFSLYNEAAFDVVCANLYPDHDPSPKWLKPYRILATKTGTKIGVIGLTAPFQAFYHQIGWKVFSPYDALDEHIEKLNKEADIIILLSHLGINDDEEIARKYKEVDVIIGGHTHHLFQNGEYINDTLLTAAGKHGTHLGEIAMVWDSEQQKIDKKAAYAVPTESMRKDSGVTDSVQALRERAVQQLKTPVTVLDEPLHVAWFKETTMMSILTNELRKWTEADLSMLNAGVLLDHLKEGPVTYEDVHRICPHPMNPCKVEVTGAELIEIIRVAHTKKLTEIRLKGLGFRGEVIGKMIFSGVDITGDEDEEGMIRVKQVFVNGEAIDRNRLYSLATADTFTFGRLFPEIAYARQKKYYMPELLRDLLAKALSRQHM